MKTTFLAAAFALLTAPLAAHEFWIDPEGYQVAPGAPLVAALRVGEKLEGSSYAFIPRNFRRFDIAMNGGLQPVEGRPGDRPALNMAVAETGLATLVHVTTDSRLTYTDWQKFINFAEHKDFTEVLAQHMARGLPQTGFVELYSRHAKSLIAVGDGAGQDIEVGLLTEIVALTNPYTDALEAGMALRVLYQGAPRADVQLELYERAPDGTVSVSLHRTDQRGEVQVPVRPGHVYLADHVVMRPLEPEAEGDPVWESLWASLTFAVPD